MGCGVWTRGMREGLAPLPGCENGEGVFAESGARDRNGRYGRPGPECVGRVLRYWIGEELDEAGWLAMVHALPIGQRMLAVAAVTLPFVEEDRQRSHEGEVSSRWGVAHLAMILPLGVIAAIMLLDLDAPITADEAQESVGVGFLGVKAADSVARFPGGLGDLPPPQMIHLLMEAEDLGCPGQTDRGSLNDLAPELAFLDPPVAFIDRLSLRGEYRPPKAVGPWRRPGVDCP